MAVSSAQADAEGFDHSDGDSAFEFNSSSSIAETLSSEILRGVQEYGRTYPSYGSHEYGMPIDEQELERIDMNHAKILIVLDKRLFLAPIDPHPQRILDLGTGTGIWAIDVADEFPSAEVRGADLAPVQPNWLPPNCVFEIEDIEMSWTWTKNSFDLIHARSLMLSVRDWPKLARQCYEQVTSLSFKLMLTLLPRHTRPGGFVEFQTASPELKCDDGSTPEDSGLMAFSKLGLEASAKIAVSLSAFKSWKSDLEAAGFVDVIEQRYKMPSSPWPSDKRLRLIGAFEQRNLLSGLSGMSLRLFSKAFGWSQDKTERYLVDVRRDIKNLEHHSYWEFIVVYGRKPEQSQKEWL